MLLVECYDSNTIIEAKIDGAVPSGIWGHIISPACIAGLQINSPHIPSFSMPYVEWYKKDGEITLKGIVAMFSAMIYVYECYKLIETDLDEIQRIFQIIKISVYLAHYQETMLTDDMYSNIRKDLKRNLKQNILSSKEYGLELRKAKKSNERYLHVQWEIEKKLSEYFNNRYNIFLDISLSPQFIDRYINVYL